MAEIVRSRICFDPMQQQELYQLIATKPVGDNSLVDQVMQQNLNLPEEWLLLVFPFQLQIGVSGTVALVECLVQVRQIGEEGFAWAVHLSFSPGLEQHINAWQIVCWPRLRQALVEAIAINEAIEDVTDFDELLFEGVFVE